MKFNNALWCGLLVYMTCAFAQAQCKPEKVLADLDRELGLIWCLGSYSQNAGMSEKDFKRCSQGHSSFMLPKQDKVIAGIISDLGQNAIEDFIEKMPKRTAGTVLVKNSKFLRGSLSVMSKIVKYSWVMSIFDASPAGAKSEIKYLHIDYNDKGSEAVLGKRTLAFLKDKKKRLKTVKEIMPLCYDLEQLSKTIDKALTPIKVKSHKLLLCKNKKPSRFQIKFGNGNDVKYDIQAPTRARFTSSSNKTETYILEKFPKKKGLKQLTVKKKGFADQKIQPSVLDRVRAQRRFNLAEKQADMTLALRTSFAAEGLAHTTKQKCPPEKKAKK